MAITLVSDLKVICHAPRELWSRSRITPAAAEPPAVTQPPRLPENQKDEILGENADLFYFILRAGM
jgi:hypothetical protein